MNQCLCESKFLFIWERFCRNGNTGSQGMLLWQETSAGFHTRAVLFAFSSAECEHSNLCRNCRVLHVITGFLDHSI